jgi:hypothetical protein
MRTAKRSLAKGAQLPGSWLLVLEEEGAKSMYASSTIRRSQFQQSFEVGVKQQRLVRAVR